MTRKPHNQVNLTRKPKNRRPYTNPMHAEEEVQNANSHLTATIQLR